MLLIYTLRKSESRLWEKKIFRHKREYVTGEQRYLHDEGLYNVYPSPEIIMVIKSRGMRWAWHVTCLVAIKIHIKFIPIPERKTLGRPRIRWKVRLT
jgi:hypothetical protein